MDLPKELQFAPIFSFTSFEHDQSRDYMACGNFYNVIPYEGRYDALQPTFFSYNNSIGSFKYGAELASIMGQARDAKWINYADGGKVLIIARNNQPLIFLKPSHEKQTN